MNPTLDQLQEFLPFLIPLIIIQLALAIFSLVHVLRHPNYKFGNKILWIVIVLSIQFIGPAVYFAIGKGDEE